MMNRFPMIRAVLALFAVTITLSSLTGCQTKATVASTTSAAPERKDPKDYKAQPELRNTNPHNGQ